MSTSVSPDTTKTVRIERGKYTPFFQVTRAWISAASALVSIDRTQAIEYIDEAIHSLGDLKVRLTTGGAQ